MQFVQDEWASLWSMMERADKRPTGGIELTGGNRVNASGSDPLLTTNRSIDPPLRTSMSMSGCCNATPRTRGQGELAATASRGGSGSVERVGYIEQQALESQYR